jgi:arylsulfatase A-like enzyme
MILANVLWMITDQLCSHALSCYGNPSLRTPNLDSLASLCG